MADFLIGIPKWAMEPAIPVEFYPGMECEINFQNPTENETFRLIVDRSRIDPGHAKYELLARKCIVLLRFEINASPHWNPDGEEIPCPHLHTYREGYGDAWAAPAEGLFGDSSDPLACLHGFLGYCNVVQAPQLREVGGFFR